jgi:hypothetical protein
VYVGGCVCVGGGGVRGHGVPHTKVEAGGAV